MSSTMLTVPVNSSLGPGHLYTVVLVYAEASSVPSVAGGRLAKTHFPIESWPKSHECPYPTIMDDNYKVYASIDSHEIVFELNVDSHHLLVIAYETFAIKFWRCRCHSSLAS